MNNQAFPRYRSHKTVEALKIRAIVNPNEGIPEEDDGERVMTFTDEGHEALAVVVSAEYVKKHNPQVGGYYIRYADGYESWSPAEVFESGYTRI